MTFFSYNKTLNTLLKLLLMNGEGNQCENSSFTATILLCPFTFGQFSNDQWCIREWGPFLFTSFCSAYNLFVSYFTYAHKQPLISEVAHTYTHTHTFTIQTSLITKLRIYGEDPQIKTLVAVETSFEFTNGSQPYLSVLLT